MQIKALTISQPWADLIRSGDKFVENRTWLTPYRGRLAIHAGKGTQYLAKAELSKRVTGAVVAIAELVACVNKSAIERAVRASDEALETLIEGTRYTIEDVFDHKYSEGPCLWVLDNIRPIEPIAVPGKQGLWIWTVDQSQIKYLEPQT